MPVVADAQAVCDRVIDSHARYSSLQSSDSCRLDVSVQDIGHVTDINIHPAQKHSHLSVEFAR